MQVSNVSTVQELTFDPATGRSRTFVFRVCSTDVVMGSMLATFARESLHARRAAILYEVGRVYSTRLARSFIEHFDDPARGREVEEFSYLSLETDFRAQLRAIRAFDPDVLFVPGSFTDATLIAGQASAVGLEATLLGADAWSNPLLFKRSGPPGEAYFVDHCSPPTAWNARYGETFRRPAHGCRAALAYDALRTVAAGLRRLGPLTEEALAARLPETRRRLREHRGRGRLLRPHRPCPLRRRRRSPHRGRGARGRVPAGRPPRGPRPRLGGGALGCRVCGASSAIFG